MSPSLNYTFSESLDARLLNVNLNTFMDFLSAWAIWMLSQCMALDAEASTCYIQHMDRGMIAQVCTSHPYAITHSDRKIVFRGKTGTLIVLPHNKCQET